MSIAAVNQRLDVATIVAASVAIVIWSSSFAGIAYGLQAFTPAELSLYVS